MLFEESVILCFVSVLSFAVAEGVGEYDKNGGRAKLISPTACPTMYSNYIKSSANKYDKKIKTCRADEVASKLRLEQESTKSQQKLEEGAGDSCARVMTCSKSADGDFYTCLAKETASSSMSMYNMYYEANRLQSNYHQQMGNIKETRITCTNSTTQELSEQTVAANNEVGTCFRFGIWGLPEP